VAFAAVHSHFMLAYRLNSQSFIVFRAFNCYKLYIYRSREDLLIHCLPVTNERTIGEIRMVTIHFSQSLVARYLRRVQAQCDREVSNLKPPHKVNLSLQFDRVGNNSLSLVQSQRVDKLSIAACAAVYVIFVTSFRSDAVALLGEFALWIRKQIVSRALERPFPP
jgi:hypothetical protein